MSRRRPFKRTDRLGSQIRQVLATTVALETREEALSRVAITDVQVTRDLSVARVYYDMQDVGGGADADEVARAVDAAFARANGFLRKRVGDAIHARITPELRFIRDEAVVRGRRVASILADLAASEDVGDGAGPPAVDEGTADDDGPSA